MHILWMNAKETVMRNFVRGLAWDAMSFGAVVSFMAMIALWGDAIAWASSN